MDVILGPSVSPSLALRRLAAGGSI